MRFKANIKYDCFDALTWIVSQFMMNKRTLNYHEYSVIFMECVDTLKSKPGQLKKKGALARFLLRYPIEMLKYQTLIFRKTLRDYNEQIQNVLLNPRSAGSEKWKKYKNFHLMVVFEPGLSKHHFPPQKFVGVGYRDKGNSRKSHIDASPSWQEVSMDEDFQNTNKKKDIRNSLGYLDLLLYEERYKELRYRQEKLAWKRRRELRECWLD
jgi:hypothetical protein